MRRTRRHYVTLFCFQVCSCIIGNVLYYSMSDKPESAGCSIDQAAAQQPLRTFPDANPRRVRNNNTIAAHPPSGSLSTDNAVSKNINSNGASSTSGTSDSSGTSVQPIKILRYMNGYKGKPYTLTLTYGNYVCLLESGGTNTTGADISMFNPIHLDHYRRPPCNKSRHELWAFASNEAQSHLHHAEMTEWDGLFNYSATFIRESDGTLYSFRDQLVEKLPPSAQNFADKYKLRQPRALWLVSHCLNKWKQHQVGSARSEYVLQLAKHIHIDVYTRGPDCRELFDGLIINGSEPELSDYVFYLSFENSLCKDYISEKFWKVLEAEGPTIPVALGGLSLEDYDYVAPPNSYIHVRNFTSPKVLADHLRFVARDDHAFNYYHEWRNVYSLQHQKKKKLVGDSYEYFCRLAHTKPHRIWSTFSEDFGKHKCRNVSTPDLYCSYYNFTCDPLSKD